MSNLKAQIQEDMKTAMRAKDKATLDTVRLIMAAIKQKEVDERIELNDAMVTAILDKMIKQRRDSISQYEQGGRPELAAKEQTEIEVLQRYMPQPLSAAEITGLISQAINDTGASAIADMGKVMAQLKPALQGRADMSQVSQQVRQQLGA